MPAELQASHGPGRAPNSSSSGATEGAFGGRSPDSVSKDHEPRNVQVDLVESQGGSIIRLRDAGGVVPGDSGGRDASVATSDGEESGTEDPEVGRTEPETKAREGGGGSPSRTGIARDGETDFERTEADMALDAARERITGLEAELETAAQWTTDLVEEVKVLSVRE